jgi:hypothetical protein
MSALFSRQADAFAEALEGAGDPAFGTLLATVEWLRAAPDPEPAAGFRDELRTRLLREAEVTPAHRSEPARTHRARGRRRALVAAGVLAVVGGTAGVAAAAESAGPGDLLYPVKQAIERIEAAFGHGRREQGEALLGRADTRLVQLASLSRSSYREEGPSTVSGFADDAHRGSDLLLLSFESTRDESTVAIVRAFAARTMEQLEALDESTGGALSADLAAAAVTLQEIDTRAAVLCPTCSDLPLATVPPGLRTAPLGKLVTSFRERPGSPTVGTPSKPRRDSGGQSHGPADASPPSPAASSTGGLLDPVTSAVDDVVSEVVSQADDLLSPGTLGLP